MCSEKHVCCFYNHKTTSFVMNYTCKCNVHTIKLDCFSSSIGSTPKNGNDDLSGKWPGFFSFGANQWIIAILPVPVKENKLKFILSSGCAHGIYVVIMQIM